LRAHRRQLAFLLSAGILAAAVGILTHELGALGWLEQRSVDARFAVRGDQAPSKSIAIVALDTESYRRLPLPPLPRSLDAEVVEHLTRAGARVIAFDFALERPSTSSSADLRLAHALSRSGHAVVSVTAVETGGGTAPLVGRVPFASAGVRPGVTLLDLDSDGAVRRFPSGLGGIPSFALASAQSYTPAVAPSPPSGALIDYPGPPGTVPSLSFAEVLAGHFDPGAVRGRIVVVGPTAPVLQDIHRSPVGAGMAGPEIQADAIATALAGFPLREVPSLAMAATLLGLALTVPLLLLASSWAWRRAKGRDARETYAGAPEATVVLGVGALVVAAWSVGTQIAFNNGVVLDYTAGLLTVGLATLAAWLLAEALGRRERRELRIRFAASAPEVVDRVLHAQDGTSGLLNARTVIAGYLIEQEIGRGGMGVVYRASQLHLDRPVALKLIRPDLAESDVFRARFERESRLAAAVSHPNVIPVLDAGEDDGLLYLAMQFIEGVNLASVLRATGLLDPADAALVVEQIGGALDAAHAQMLVHRDVKPANIVLRADDTRQALLTDFGLAKSMAQGDQLTQPDGWAGTLDYLAPEQLEGREVDHRADIYALAAVLYHCLTGSVPFPREHDFATITAQLHAPRPSPTSIRPELPAAIDLVIARGMALATSERHPSAGALAADAATALGVPSRRTGHPVPATSVAVDDDRGVTEISDAVGGTTGGQQ